MLHECDQVFSVLDLVYFSGGNTEELGKLEVERDGGGGGGVRHHNLTSVYQAQVGQGELQVFLGGRLDARHGLHVQGLVLPPNRGGQTRCAHLELGRVDQMVHNLERKLWQCTDMERY